MDKRKFGECGPTRSSFGKKMVKQNLKVETRLRVSDYFNQSGISMSIFLNKGNETGV